MADSTQTFKDRDNLFGSDYPIIYDEVTIVAGQSLTRGAVLGIITTGGKATLLSKDSVDGSEDFYAVLTRDTDATSEDKIAPVAISGTFQTQGLSFGANTVAADIKVEARLLNCYVQTSDAAYNVVGG